MKNIRQIKVIGDKLNTLLEKALKLSAELIESKELISYHGNRQEKDSMNYAWALLSEIHNDIEEKMERLTKLINEQAPGNKENFVPSVTAED